MSKSLNLSSIKAKLPGPYVAPKLERDNMFHE